MISNTLPQSLIDNPILSQWIAFEQQAASASARGKVEIGQGILTALTQIAAEELDVTFEQVNLVSGQTDVSPGEGFTSGSYSIAVGGASIRLVCAEVRSLFLDRAAETLGCPVGELAIEDGKIPPRRKGHRPRLLVDGGRSRARPARDRHRAGEAAVDLPHRRHATCRASTCRRRSPAQPSSTISRPTTCRACARAAAAVARRAPRRARRGRGAQGRAKRRSTYLREGDFVAFTADSEIAVMRAAEAARTQARWDGGDAGARLTSASRTGSRRSPRALAPSRPGRAGPAPQRPPRRGALFAAVPHLWLDRPGLRARRIQGRHAQGVVAHPGSGRAARLARTRARPCRRAGHGAPPPGRRRLRPQHRRRRGLRRRLHRDADAGPDHAGAVVARGRIPVARRSAPRWRSSSRAVLDADNKPADWTIEIWSAPHAQRPGMNGNANFTGAEALPNAPPPQRAQRRAGRARRRRNAQRDRDLRPAAPSADPSPAAAGAAAHLLAARARRLGQCLRDRVVHRRTGRDRRRRPGDLPAVAAVRPARAACGRDRGRR